MNDKKLFTVRDVVWFVTLIVGILSTYLVMRGDINSLKSEVAEIKGTLQVNNLEVINYRVGEIDRKTDEFIKSFNDFVSNYHGGN